MDTWEVGQLIRLSGRFTSAAGTLQDPTAVFVSVEEPDGTVTVYEYGEDSEVVKDSAGLYHADIPADAAGNWFYRWWATGTGMAAKVGQYKIIPVRAVV